MSTVLFSKEDFEQEPELQLQTIASSERKMSKRTCFNCGNEELAYPDERKVICSKCGMEIF